MHQEEWLTLREAADALGISEVSARRWVKSGKLKATQPGRRYRIPRSAVEELLDPKAPAPPSPEQPPLNGFEEERRRQWGAAVRSARRLRLRARIEMENALAAWRASKERGEAKDARRDYLDAMAELLQQAYDAESALWALISGPANVLDLLTVDVDEFEEGQEASRFYGELWGMVDGAEGLNVRTEDAQEKRPKAVEESDAA